jgi:protoporphyrinogen oxidase
MRVAVVGGGVLGLATAFYLTRAVPTPQIEVFEAADQPGGLSTWEDYGPFVWDRFYHCILPSDLHLIRFIEDLGLGDRLRWRTTRTGLFRDGRLHSISDSLEFLRFPLLGMVDKLRLAAMLAYTSRIADWRALERERAEDWLVRMCGRRAYEIIWGPLLRAKYGDAYRRVSAVAIWAAIARLYSARQPGLGKEVLGYVDGGYRAVLTRVIERLQAAGAAVHLSAPVDHVQREGGLFHVAGNHGAAGFDRVAVTVAPPLAARLLPPETVDVAALEGLEFLGVVCLALVLERSLSPFYILNVADRGLPFTGVIEMSNLLSADQRRDHHLVYVPRYVPADDPLYRADTQHVRALFLAGLRRIFPAFREAWIVRDVVSRAPCVQPLQVVDYSRRVARTGTHDRRVPVVNTSRLVNATLNNNEVVRLALDLSREVLDAR